MAALSVRLPCSGNAGPSGALSQFPSPCFPSAAYTPSFLSVAFLQECHLGVCAFGLIPHSCSPHQDTRLVSHLSALTYVYFQPPEMHCPGRLPNSTLSGERERERETGLASPRALSSDTASTATLKRREGPRRGLCHGVWGSQCARSAQIKYWLLGIHASSVL